jgi:carbamoylphosphate synthase large subunit
MVGSRVRILLCGDESTGTLAAVRGLRAAGHEVWLAVSRNDTYAARSGAVAGVFRVTSPGVDLARHGRDLLEAARVLQPAVVLPGTEGSLRALTGREHEFDAGTVLATCSQESLDRATDKRLLAELARRAGLDPAPTIDLHRSDRALERTTFPAMVKPLQTVYEDNGKLSVVKGRRVEDAEELRRVLDGAAGRLRLLQPYLEGTLGAVCGVVWRGELVCAVHQRSPRIWPPRSGNSSYALTVPPDLRLEAGAAELVRAIGWSGLFGVQFVFRGAQGYVIDFNPRVYGSLALAIAAGANLPALWVDCLLGREVGDPGYRPGVRYRVEEDDFRALVSMFRQGRAGEALRGLLPRRHTTHGIFRLSDPKPSVVTMQKLLPRRRWRAPDGRRLREDGQ